MNQRDAARRAFIGFFFLTTLLTALWAGVYFSVNRWLKTPGENTSIWKIIEIPAGTPLSSISKILKNNGLINSQFLFRLVGQYWQKNSLKAGEYKLSTSMTPETIFSILQEGKEHLYSITVPEGLNFYEIAMLFEKSKFSTKNEFIRLCTDKNFISKFRFIDADSLEGYLFPSTYFFRKGETTRNMIKKMVQTFKEEVLSDIIQGVAESGLTPLEVVVLASLIEKETSQEEEKKTVSSVFTNRLKKGMRLQCDPTVIYAIKNFDGNIRKKDLKINSPYNTYLHKGLPPGPIANPGKTSILAALYPSKTTYLYFVATKKGGHYFSRTLKNHNRAVRKFQLNRGWEPVRE